MSNKLTISFGALSDPIQKQIENAGLIAPMNCNALQISADAISRLFINSYITSSMADSARKKLMKDISKEVSKLNMGYL